MTGQVVYRFETMEAGVYPFDALGRDYDTVLELFNDGFGAALGCSNGALVSSLSRSAVSQSMSNGQRAVSTRLMLMTNPAHEMVISIFRREQSMRRLVQITWERIRLRA